MRNKFNISLQSRMILSKLHMIGQFLKHYTEVKEIICNQLYFKKLIKWNTILVRGGAGAPQPPTCT